MKCSAGKSWVLLIRVDATHRKAAPSCRTVHRATPQKFLRTTKESSNQTQTTDPISHWNKFDAHLGTQRSPLPQHIPAPYHAPLSSFIHDFMGQT